MKVTAFNGSPHNDGVVAKGISIMAEELAKQGIETEVIHVGNKKIQGCMDCKQCWQIGHCAVEDDIVQPASLKMQASDGIIIGSPVYYGGVAGTFKSFLDRLFFSGPNTKMKYKVGATVTSLRRSGGVSTYHELNNYFNLAQIIITPSIYWDVFHGNNEDEVKQDKEGLQIIKVQGMNMAWLIKTLAAGKKEIPYPVLPDREWTNFI